MGEEAYDETILSSVHGAVYVRGGYGRESLWLGLSRTPDPEGSGDPDVVVELSQHQVDRLRDALGAMMESAVRIQRDELAERVTKLRAALTEIAVRPQDADDIEAEYDLMRERASQALEADDEAEGEMMGGAV